MGMTTVEVVIKGDDKNAKSVIGQQIMAALRVAGYRANLKDPEPAPGFVKVGQIVMDTIVNVVVDVPPAPAPKAEEKPGNPETK